jgi:hypothetical protein
VKREARMALEQRGPFLERFLDPALAEVALAGGNQRFDLADAASLADGEEGDVGRVAAGDLCRASDGVENILKAVGSVAHGRAIGRAGTGMDGLRI